MAIWIDVGQSISSRANEWYKVVQHLGTGGNAVTFLVLATSGINSGSLFALKIFQRVTDADRLQKFHREIEFLEQCDHPSIMRTHDSGEFIAKGQTHPFVVMEYLPVQLRAELKKAELDITSKLSICTQLASALAYLSSLDPAIAHRDVKPENIFLKGKTCVLGDFGLMKICEPEEDEAAIEDDRTDLKSYIGMPFWYRTPDLVRYSKGESNICPRSDVFQLGLVLTELFTGRNPCKKPANKLDEVQLEDIGNIPGELGGLVFSVLAEMLKFDPANRLNGKALVDRWNSAFNIAVEKSHALNGRAI